MIESHYSWLASRLAALTIFWSLAAVMPVSALDIKIDIDSHRVSAADTTAAIMTQSGFTSWDLTNVQTSGSTITVDGVTFEIFGLAAANQSRNRGVSGGGGGDFNSELTDFVYNEGASGRFVGLRISNLPVGTYAMQSWHYDSFSTVISNENYTQVDVRTQNVAGSTVTFANMVPFSLAPISFLVNVTAPGQVKEVVFQEDDVPTATDATDSNRARLNGFTLVTPVELSLEVNTTTGATRIVNNEGISFDIGYYEIRSIAGSLKPSGWISLDDTDAGPDPIGNGWDESPNSNVNLLNEARLTQSNTLAPGQSENLGTAFTVGSTQDLLFFYGGPNDAALRMGAVKYVTGAGAIAGDYNGNGVVDAADYVLWRNGGILQNEGRSTGVTDFADFMFWRMRFSATSSGAAGTSFNAGSAVPEPVTLGMLSLGLIIAAGMRRSI